MLKTRPGPATYSHLEALAPDKIRESIHDADPILRRPEASALNSGKRTIADTFNHADPVSALPFEVHTFPLSALWVEDQLVPAVRLIWEAMRV
jgi:hypothetical protein